MSTTREHPSESTLAARSAGAGRWAAIAGLAFVALMLIGSELVGRIPQPDAPEREVLDYLADGDTHTVNLVGSYLWVSGALAFSFFLARLRTVLRRAEGGAGTLSNLAFGAGVAFVAVWLVSAAAYAALPYAIGFRGAPVTDPDLVRVVPWMGRFLLLQGAGFAGALFLVAAAAVIARTRVFPRWLAVLGVVAAIALLFDLIYVNITPFWAWVLVASAVMLWRPNGTAGTAGPAGHLPRGNEP